MSLRLPCERPSPRPLAARRARGPGLPAVLLALLLCGGCDLDYPEIVVVNRTAEQVQLRNLSFSGCAWNEVLAYGEATAVARCLPGSDRVHFEKLDAAAWAREQAEEGTLDGVCPCSGGLPEPEPDGGLVDPIPKWFSYQTLSVQQVELGERRVFEITLDDMEQDFSVPGPYGH